MLRIIIDLNFCELVPLGVVPKCRHMIRAGVFELCIMYTENNRMGGWLAVGVVTFDNGGGGNRRGSDMIGHKNRFCHVFWKRRFTGIYGCLKVRESSWLLTG